MTKKTYQKPTLTKREKLEGITALVKSVDPVASGPSSLVNGQ
ncbi:MAG: hypothetical protein ABJ081_08090 [Hyphomicrobiales bacterium]